MVHKNNIKNIISITLLVLFIILIFTFPQESKNGVVSGILLCGNVVIPALFPFTVCVLMLLKSGFSKIFGFLRYPIKKIFGLNTCEFSAMFLSLIGGYPIGAKVLEETCNQGYTTTKRAETMLRYCINAGPAFIVLAVGNGILHSKSLGCILLTSHILTSVIIALISSRALKKDMKEASVQTEALSFGDNFVLSTCEAASTLFNICAFVILFSAISGITESINIPFLKYIANLLEITSAVSKTKNIYFISFLLGFGGISIWLQVICCCKKIKIKILNLILSRLAHGAVSVIITYLQLRFFKFDLYAISNKFDTNPSYVYQTPTLAISLLAMAILFVISLEKKFDGRNFKNNLL